MSAAGRDPIERPLRAAVDVGGTFIDVVVAHRLSGVARIAKILHRKDRQGEDIVRGLRELTRDFDSDLPAIDSLVIGTTVVTNALLEGQLADIALVSSEGFRDVIEIARATRPSSYDLQRRRAPPLVVPAMRLTVAERLTFEGEILRPLADDDIKQLVDEVRQLDVEAVAVCLLYSYVDSRHEQLLAAALRDTGLPVSISSEVLPVFREYERTVATAVNAATIPVMSRFLDALSGLLTETIGRIYIMSSGGGCLTLAEARRFPIKCTLSGPAGGVMGAARFAAEHHLGATLTLDVGGTSSDVALVTDATIPCTEERSIGGYPIAISSVEVETIGAGGGSIAFIDATGLLKVGPRSAAPDRGLFATAKAGNNRR